MSQDNDFRQTVVDDPVSGLRERTTTISGSSPTGWWVAAAIAVVAIIGLFFMFGRDRASDSEIQAAVDSARAQAAVEQANAATQAAAAQASMATQSAVDSMSRAGEVAAANASAAAARAEAAAVSAQDAAANAATTEPEPLPQ